MIASPTGTMASLAEHLQNGQHCHSEARFNDAIAVYRSGLDLANTSGNEVPVQTRADLHARLANAFMAIGQLDSASENYTAALELVPTLTGCWCNLANVYVQTGRAQDAIPLYLQALRLTPNHWPSRTNLVQALVASGNYLMAKAVLLELTEERPGEARLFHDLGKVCFELQETDDALRHFEQAVVTNPLDAESLYWIGGIKQSQGHTGAAREAYCRAAQIQPLIRRAAIKTPADFRVLALYAPFAGNTPTEFLFKDACYETNTLSIIDSANLKLSDLDIDVVVNLISDADQSLAILPLATELVQRLSKPTVNDPAKIGRTTRDSIVRLLQDIPACRVPKTLRLQAGTDRSASAIAAALTFPFPVLARPAGTHGGDDFEKVAEIAELATFVAQHVDDDCYLIEYMDYRSADGYFRKYRFIFVGEDILPYHLAIDDDWKIHHDSTDMGDHHWMQQEELAFLKEPGVVFGARLYQALRTIRQRVDLDYFGIDCGIDAAGNLVVFEVNASMLVHHRNDAFPYKNPFVQKIKVAFDAMLGRLAARS